jgi:hypothetical protein
MSCVTSGTAGVSGIKRLEWRAGYHACAKKVSPVDKLLQDIALESANQSQRWSDLIGVAVTSEVDSERGILDEGLCERQWQGGLQAAEYGRY